MASHLRVGIALTLLLTSLVSTASTDSAGRILSLDLCMDWLLILHANPKQSVILSPTHQRYQFPIQAPDWEMHDGSLEKIFELNPDLILVGEYNALLLRQRLNALSMPVVSLALPTNLNEIETYERSFLKLIGRPVERAIAAPKPTQPAPDAPRLLLLGANGIGTGADTFEDQIVRQAGWRNYLTDRGYIHLDLERLITDPPDAILWSAPTSPSLASSFAEHPALKSALKPKDWLETEPWIWQCPGPWTWTLIDQLKEKLVR